MHLRVILGMFAVCFVLSLDLVVLYGALLPLFGFVSRRRLSFGNCIVFGKSLIFVNEDRRGGVVSGRIFFCLLGMMRGRECLWQGLVFEG